jgi:hypothetical protein
MLVRADVLRLVDVNLSMAIQETLASMEDALGA